MSAAKRKTGLSRPPVAKGADEFISGATAGPAQSSPTDKQPPAEGYPWKQPHVREDMRKLFNLRLTEPEYLKLRWLAERSPESMHQIAHAAVAAEIERRIDQLDPLDN